MQVLHHLESATPLPIAERNKGAIGSRINKYEVWELPVKAGTHVHKSSHACGAGAAVGGLWVAETNAVTGTAAVNAGHEPLGLRTGEQKESLRVGGCGHQEPRSMGLGLRPAAASQAELGTAHSYWLPPQEACDGAGSLCSLLSPARFLRDEWFPIHLAGTNLQRVRSLVIMPTK